MYIYMFICLIISQIVCVLLILLYKLISHSPNQTFAKTSPFECGFEPFNKMRRPFSLRYFILVVLFLIFDVEAVLLLPCTSQLIIMPQMDMYINMFMFLIILLGGLLFEWKNKMLDWAE